LVYDWILPKISWLPKCLGRKGAANPSLKKSPRVQPTSQTHFGHCSPIAAIKKDSVDEVGFGLSYLIKGK